MTTHTFRALLLCSLVLIGFGVWRAVVPSALEPKPDAPLLVEFPSADLGNLQTGNNEFQVRIMNPNSSPRRVLGLSSGCRANACFLSHHQEPVTIPPGETVTCTWGIELHSPGPFELPLALYLEENGIREVKLTVRGVGVAPAGKTNDPPKP